ncbi:MAG: glutamate ABC transporter substrate-binding protein [Bifidobacteriaceae bacterium]|nr:glutamate ABC transporter substrate-binding protein [Bifidobacteriaceae bacterium]MEE0941218.1 glutamate ABC transporter substrate-binding protein [Bifidobacteriaceae bacterium]
MNRRKRSILHAACSFLVCAVSVVSLTACTRADEGTKLKIGIKFDQPGMGLKRNGIYEGFDVDMARYIAHDLGYKDDEIIWKETPSKQREAMLQNGDVDMIVASYSITESRKKAVTFAGPYYVAGQDLLVRASDNSISGPEDLEGKKLCTATGSTSAVNIKEKYASQVQLMEQPGFAECATALFSGAVDAVSTDDIILAGIAAGARGRLKVVGNPFTRENYGVAVRKDNVEMAEKIRDIIEDLIADGTWKDTVEHNTAGTAFAPNAEFNPPQPRVEKE